MKNTFLTWITGVVVIAGVVFFGQGSKTTTAQQNPPAKRPPITLENVGQVVRLKDFIGRGMSFSPDGSQLATLARDGILRIWDVESGELLFSVTVGGEGDNVTFAPDGTQIAAASNGYMVIVDAVSGEILRQVGEQQGSIRGAFSPDSRLFATGGRGDPAIKLWDTGTWEQVATLEGHIGSVYDLEFSLDGRWLVSSPSMGMNDIPDSDIRVWDVANATLAYILTGHTGDVHEIAISPDSRYVVSGGTDQCVRLWDLESRELVRVLKTVPSGVMGMAYSPTGSLVAVVVDDIPPVTLLEIEHGSVAFRLQGHTVRAQKVAFSPDGSLIATSDDEDNIILWGISDN